MSCRILPRSLPACLLFAALAVALAAPARAERPSAMKLFPEETLVFLRMANAQEFGERLQQTSLGRMLRDPQLQPFVEQLYGDLGELYTDEAEAEVGISWADLQNLPRGEVAFGVVARPDRAPALLLLVDQGEEPSVAERLMERALELATERGADLTTEKIADVEVKVVRDADRPNRMFGIFQRENAIVAATDPNVLRNVLWHWNGGGESFGAAPPAAAAGNERSEETESTDSSAEDSDATDEAEFIPSRTLAENDRFATIVRHCRRPQDPPPQLLFYIDPIELARHVGRNQGGVQFALGLLPSLGADGLHAIGAALTYATDEYDDLSHLHVLLENPRAGVLQLPAFEPGETTPQPFVPYALETYITWQSNLRTTYDRLAALVDQYRYEGSVDKLVQERLSEPLGIDFLADVIDNLAGRFTWIVAYETPARFRGRQHVIAAQLLDEQAAAESLQAVMKKYADLFEERRFGEITYYAIVPEGLEDVEEEQRPFDPCVAIMDGYLFLGGSCQLFERCVAARDGTIERLVDSDDYARTTAVLGRETAGATPVMFSITRAEEMIRHLYDLLNSERTRELIDEHKEDNRFLAALADALDQHQLPPFDILAPYFAPGGGILYDTDSGYHAISFTLRDETGR